MANDVLQNRVGRDKRNGEVAGRAARQELSSLRDPRSDVASPYGSTVADHARIEYAEKRRAALQAIATDPFQVMLEVCTEVESNDGELEERRELWYANASSSVNEVFQGEEGRVPVLAWTHPGVQLALAADLGETRDIRASGLRLRSVEPTAKARFDGLTPEISGVYEPGGAVRPRKRRSPGTGLKAIKLDMTRDQTQAFVARMKGLMVITGAPGSGKTTVAFQRIRFLFDQQELRNAQGRMVRYAPELTSVFLANENLAEQAKALLAAQLGIPRSVVRSVSDFVDSYLDQVWIYKHNARPRQRKLVRLELAARTAVLGLSDHHDLGHLWETYERQVLERLSSAGTADWASTAASDCETLKSLAAGLIGVGSSVSPDRDPLRSRVSMTAVYSRVGRSYDAARTEMQARTRSGFDEQFQRWLFWVYDPLAAVATYFGSHETEAAQRMRRGTGARVHEAEILEHAVAEWEDRIYGPEDRPWLAWLLRFALPETTDPQGRFREIPSAIAPAMIAGERLSHVAIDEAQDLCVAEASLLGSLVDPDGALTVSADFRQIVSPVHGMQSPEALGVGRSLHGKGTDLSYPFARNMRQSKQIGRFLRSFHEVVFRERPTFEANPDLDDRKPQLILAPPQNHALRIKQFYAALRHSTVVASVAVLQINEDEQALMRLRAELETASVPLAPVWAAKGEGLLTTSVERIKGLEFDACIVLGLEEVETAALNFTLNRAYVALSRPSRRLALLCTDFPGLLHKVDKSLFDVLQA